jgi:hypothetical protein
MNVLGIERPSLTFRKCALSCFQQPPCWTSQEALICILHDLRKEQHCLQKHGRWLCWREVLRRAHRYFYLPTPSWHVSNWPWWSGALLRTARADSRAAHYWAEKPIGSRECSTPSPRLLCGYSLTSRCGTASGTSFCREWPTTNKNIHTFIIKISLSVVIQLQTTTGNYDNVELFQGL